MPRLLSLFDLDSCRDQHNSVIMTALPIAAEAVVNANCVKRVFTCRTWHDHARAAKSVHATVKFHTANFQVLRTQRNPSSASSEAPCRYRSKASQHNLWNTTAVAS